MVIRRDEYLVTTARDLGAALKHFRTAAEVTQADPGALLMACFVV
jgi:BioD-like phosphotransacetylase family protein